MYYWWYSTYCLYFFSSDCSCVQICEIWWIGIVSNSFEGKYLFDKIDTVYVRWILSDISEGRYPLRYCLRDLFSVKLVYIQKCKEGNFEGRYLFRYGKMEMFLLGFCVWFFFLRVGTQCCWVLMHNIGFVWG